MTPHETCWMPGKGGRLHATRFGKILTQGCLYESSILGIILVEMEERPRRREREMRPTEGCHIRSGMKL